MSSTIKVNASSKVQYRISPGVNFAFVSSPENGRVQLTEFFTCRDYMNDTMRNFYLGLKEFTMPLDTDRLRVLIAHNGTNPDWAKKFFVAKKIINLYEELAGFDKKSIVTRVEHSKPENVKECWQLLGPGEWMRYSQLVSMVTLIIRAVVSAKLVKAPETVKEAEKLLNSLVRESSEGIASDYTHYLPRCILYFSLLMERFKDIFTLDVVKAHTTEKAFSWHESGGVYSLCRYKTGVDGLDTKLHHLFETKQ